LRSACELPAFRMRRTDARPFTPSSLTEAPSLTSSRNSFPDRSPGVLRSISVPWRRRSPHTARHIVEEGISGQLRQQQAAKRGPYELNDAVAGKAKAEILAAVDDMITNVDGKTPRRCAGESSSFGPRRRRVARPRRRRRASVARWSAFAKIGLLVHRRPAKRAPARPALAVQGKRVPRFGKSRAGLVAVGRDGALRRTSRTIASI